MDFDPLAGLQSEDYEFQTADPQIPEQLVLSETITPVTPAVGAVPVSRCRSWLFWLEVLFFLLLIAALIVLIVYIAICPTSGTNDECCHGGNCSKVKEWREEYNKNTTLRTKVDKLESQNSLLKSTLLQDVKIQKWLKSTTTGD